MKKIVTLTLILLVVGLALVYAQNTLKNTKKPVIKELSELYEQFGDSFFKSLFSIDEIKGYSILQIEKIMENYNNNSFLSYDFIFSKLKNTERTNLLININELIVNQDTKENQDKIISLIRNWCIAENQFDFLINKVRINKVELIQSSIKILNSSNNSSEVINQKDEIDLKYNKLLNYIASLDKANQLEFYSSLYHEIALNQK